VATSLTQTRTGAVDSDPTARLSRLIREQFGFVWRLLRGIGVNELEAVPALQEVFKAASQRMADLRPGSQRSFLLSTTLRVAARVQQSRVQEPAISDAAPALEDLDEPRQAREILGALLAQMPLELRVVFVLKEIEQLADLEIADIVGIPVATVVSRLAEAHEDFATHLETESEWSLSLLRAAREEQPPPDALAGVFAASGIRTPGADTAHEAGPVSSSRLGSVRSGSRDTANSGFQLGVKWLVFGVLAGLAASVVVYAVKDASLPRNAQTP
jgi:RNA polymerase sigma-70 factor, ECF subfamily